MSEMATVNFCMDDDPFYSAANMEYLARVTEEIDSGKAQLAEHELLEE